MPEGLSPRTFYEGTPTTSSALLATVPAGEEWILDEVACDNTTTAAATLTLNHGANGAAAATGNQILSAVSCAANVVTKPIGSGGPEGRVLAPGDVIRGLQGTAAALNVTIAGRVRRFQ